jgi:hypothetical protein
MAYELIVESTPPVARSLGSGRFITDFLANVKLSIGEGDDLDLMSKSISPGEATTKEALHKLISVVSRVREALEKKDIMQMVKLEICIPDELVSEVSSHMSSGNPSFEYLRKLGVTWTEQRCDASEIESLKARLLKGKKEHIGVKVTVADAFRNIMNAIESTAKYALDKDLPLKCL